MASPPSRGNAYIAFSLTSLSLPSAVLVVGALLATTIGTASAALNEPPEVTERVDQLVASGDAAEQAGDLDQAIVDYREAVEIAVRNEPELRKNLKRLRKLRAEEVVAEADVLLAAEQYQQAAERYIDAMGYFGIRASTAGLRKATRPALKASRSTMREQARAFTAGDYAGVVDALEPLLGRPGTPASVLMNLVLAHRGLDQREQAALYLDQYLAGTADGPTKTSLRELRALLVTDAQPIYPENKRIIHLRVNKLLADRMDGKAPTDGTAEEGDVRLCEMIDELASDYGDHPTVIFDQARCSELRGELEAAREGLLRYLGASPEALDGDVVRRHAQALGQLLAESGPGADEFRRQVAQGRARVDVGRYREAIAHYEQALTLRADHPIVLWRLALLHDALLEPPPARAYYERYLAHPQATAERAAAARAALSTMDARQARYAALVAEGALGATSVLERVFDAYIIGTAIDREYIARELTKAGAPLAEAVSLFPLGARANRHLAFVAQQSNNFAQARRSLEAVNAHGAEPGYFVALQEIIGEEKKLRKSIVRLSFAEDGLRIRTLVSRNRQQREWFTAWPEGGLSSALWEDGLIAGDRFVDPGEVPNVYPVGAAVEFASAQTKHLAAPFILVGRLPDGGKELRTLGNEYGRLYRRFGRFAQVTLGPERVTLGDALIAATEIAAAYYTGYYAAWVRTGDLSPLALGRGENVEARDLERLRREQRRVIEPRRFKLIPLNTEWPEFGVR